MSDEKKPLQDYRKAVNERAAKMREARREQSGVPDLAQADAMYKPRDGTMTLRQMREAQNVTADRPQAGLSEQTVAGLQAMKAEMDKRYAEERAKGAPVVEPETEEKKPEVEPMPDTKAAQRQIETKLRDIDDLELDRIAARIQYDVINNDEERAAVEERIKAEGREISLEDGLSKGFFEQTVPITKKLHVTYRSVSPYEIRCIRQMLWKMCETDPRLENLASDIYGMLLVAASVVRINGTALPEHMKGQDFHRASFDEDVMRSKYELLSRYPGPMIHAIGVHSNWFDDRVRRTFTTDSLKNG